MLDTVVISSDDLCCSVVFGTLVCVFSVMWSEFLKRVEGAFTSPMRTECGMCVMHRMQCCMPVPSL